MSLLHRHFPRDVLEYRNDSVIDRVAAEEGVDRRVAEAWFVEMLKFLQLCAASDQVLAPSDPVDHAWHAFVLHMHDYEKFCRHYFGKVIYHQPSGEPEPAAFERTRRAYVDRYGPVPNYYGYGRTGIDPIWPLIWFDAGAGADSHHDHGSSPAPAVAPGGDAGPAGHDGDGGHGEGGHGDGGGGSNCSGGGSSEGGSSDSGGSSCGGSSCSGGSSCGSSCGGSG